MNQENMNHPALLQSETTTLNNITETTKTHQNNHYSCRIPDLTMTGHNEFQKGENILISTNLFFHKRL